MLCPEKVRLAKTHLNASWNNRHSLAITSTCKEIRNECLDALFSTTTIAFYVRSTLKFVWSKPLTREECQCGFRDIKASLEVFDSWLTNNSFATRVQGVIFPAYIWGDLTILPDMTMWKLISPNFQPTLLPRLTKQPVVIFELGRLLKSSELLCGCDPAHVRSELLAGVSGLPAVEGYAVVLVPVDTQTAARQTLSEASNRLERVSAQAAMLSPSSPLEKCNEGQNWHGHVEDVVEELTARVQELLNDIDAPGEAGTL